MIIIKSKIGAEMKKCSTCKKEKALDEFSKNKSRKDGLQYECRECRAKTGRKYYEDNKETLAKQNKEYRTNNKDGIAVKKKEWQDDNKDKRAKQQKERYKTDINYRLICILRSRLRDAIKNNYKVGSAVKDLGCNITFLKWHLEAQFTKGMSWDNHSLYGWHIDHIKPLVNFDLTNRKQFLEANHFSNLQPLWAEDNLSKGCKI